MTNQRDVAKLYATRGKDDVSARMRLFTTQFTVGLAWGFLAVLGTLAFLPRPVAAQPYAAFHAEPQITLAEDAYNALLQRLAALEESAARRQAGPQDNAGEDVSGLTWTNQIGGRVHVDYVNFLRQNADSHAAIAPAANPGGDAQDAVAFRRLFLLLSGEGFGVYDYRMILQLAGLAATGPAVQLEDVSVGLREVPVAGHLRFGYTRAPMSLEELTRGAFTSFMERGLPNVFAPQRQLGVCAENASAGENLAWSCGAYFDNLDNYLKQREDDNQGLTLAARTTCTPYYDESSGGRYLVQLGASCRYTDDQDDAIRFRSRPDVYLGPQWIDSGVIRRDDFQVLGLEHATVWGPWSAQAEFFYAPVGAHRFQGAYLYGTWFLTGENRVYNRRRAQFERITPHTNFWIVRGAGMGGGAVELETRWSMLDVSGGPDLLAGVQQDLTFGVNWYWTAHIRWMFEYLHAWTKYDAPARGVAENDMLAVRGQLDF